MYALKTTHSYRNSCHTDGYPCESRKRINMPTSFDHEISLEKKIDDYYKKHKFKRFLKRFIGDIYCDEEIQLLLYLHDMSTTI